MSSRVWVPAGAPPAVELGPEYPAWLATLLARRGVTDAETARRFLEPRIEHLEPPGRIVGLTAALERLVIAKERGQRVVVVGDYDADGVSSTAILVASLRANGLEVEPILPDRLEEGYGFSPIHATRAAAAGAALIVTVDCGTSAHDAVAAALECQLDVIIVDHHQPGAPLPESVILVNPLVEGPEAAGVGLAAAGLAFKVAVGLFERLGRTAPIGALLRIAAIGTIADMVPLRGENRVIAAVGLRELGTTRSLGLQALFRSAGIDPRGGLQSDDIGFRIAPRINAAGRLGTADPALELLLTRDGSAARELAAQLELANSERREAEAEVVNGASARFEALGDDLPPILIEWDESWHRGVVGIAAGRLARTHSRPTILLGVEDGVATGSGRSIPGIHLHQFLAESGSDLLRFGGHEQAIGLSVEAHRLEDLRSRWIEQARSSWPADLLRPRLTYDAEVEPAAVTADFHSSLERLAPHGMGNPKPILRIGPLEVAGTLRSFGRSAARLHLGGAARPAGQRGPIIPFVGWGWDVDGRAKVAGEFEVLAEVQRDHLGALQLSLLDARPAG